MRASPTRARTHSLQLAIPLPPGVCWETPASHTRPDNTSPTRYAEIVRGALLDRLDKVTSDGDRLSRLAAHFGLSNDKTADLFFVLMHLLFPESMEPDPDVSAEIIALRGKRDGLVPETGLERCSEDMLAAFAARLSR